MPTPKAILKALNIIRVKRPSLIRNLEIEESFFEKDLSRCPAPYRRAATET